MQPPPHLKYFYYEFVFSRLLPPTRGLCLILLFALPLTPIPSPDSSCFTSLVVLARRRLFVWFGDVFALPTVVLVCELGLLVGCPCCECCCTNPGA